MKFKKFYEENGMDYDSFEIMDNIACICCFCNKPKDCSKTCCKTGIVCELYDASGKLERYKKIIYTQDQLDFSILKREKRKVESKIQAKIREMAIKELEKEEK